MFREATPPAVSQEPMPPAASLSSEEESPSVISPPNPTPSNPLIERIIRVKIFRLKKDRALPDMRGRVLGKSTNTYETWVADSGIQVSIIPINLPKGTVSNGEHMDKIQHNEESPRDLNLKVSKAEQREPD